MTYRILCVEDDQGLAQLVQRRLKREGYRVDIARDGPGALKVVQNQTYDLLVVDYQLPGINGLDLMKCLKSENRFPPTIMMTAFGNEQLAVEAMKLGAVDYIVKDTNAGYMDLLPVVIEHALSHEKLKLDHEALIKKQESLIEELNAFAHTVAHELKNPLNVIIGNAEIMMELGSDQPPFIVKAQRDTHAIAYKMYSIIEELLLLSTLQLQEAKIETHLVDMDYIIDEVMARLIHLVQDTGGSIELPEEWHSAYGYTAWIEEVWVNYISNALKYGGNPPIVKIGSTLQDSMIKYWVLDNGSGVNPEIKKQLFRPFTILPGAHTVEGHGLGLSVVQRIIRHLGGEVGVEDTPEGSCFWFTLPAEVASAV